MKEKISKLMTVKSIVTILLTIVFCYMAVIGKINANEYLTIFTTVIAFYFGTQVSKDN